MKKYIIIISISIILLISGVLTYIIFFNNVYGESSTTEMQIQELRNSITQLQDTQININKYNEDQQKTTLLETKISELDTNLITMQNKINEQLQTINSLKNRIISLEQNNKNKAIGIWKGITKDETSRNIQYTFKEDNTVDFLCNDNTILNYGYNESMIFTNIGVMFYNIKGNEMKIYYGYSSRNPYSYFDTLTKQ